MANQSKSVLTPFLIIAGLIFSVALAWKFLGTKEEPKQIVAEVNDTDNNYEKTEVVLSTENSPKEIKIVSYTKPVADEPIELTSEQEAEIQLKSKYFMKFSLRYSTPELAIEGLKALRENGDSDAASALIKYILEQFPNTEIPEDLLDF